TKAAARAEGRRSLAPTGPIYLAQLDAGVSSWHSALLRRRRVVSADQANPRAKERDEAAREDDVSRTAVEGDHADEDEDHADNQPGPHTRLEGGHADLLG